MKVKAELSLLALAWAVVAPAQTTLTLDLKKPGVAVSPNLYGLMTEEINYSYDGGLYGELVRNRVFKNNGNTPEHWVAVGEGTTISLDRGQSINDALTVCLKVSAPAGRTAGVANEGYWGFPIRPSTTYKASFYAKADHTSPITLTLEGPDGKVYAQSTINGVGSTWKKFETTLVTPSGVAVTKDARLVLRAAGPTTWFNLVSLFPPTFGNQPNGFRPDLLQLLINMKPAFLRLPGGNYLEGDKFRDRFPWKETLAPIDLRPGHQGTWGYRSSDGLGFHEFMLWCEAMGAKPLLGVHAGYVLSGDVIKAGPELEGFVKDALDEIEYVIGDPKKTKWGRVRAQMGHPAPFPMEAVEVGNEDWFDRSGSYPGRYMQFAKAIRKKYPKLKIISSIGRNDLERAKVPKELMPDYVDDHYYNTSWDMMSLATQYDNYPRTGTKVFVGEWASQDIPEPWTNVEKKGPTPAMGAALGDAAFMTGLERNSDVVHMACYAPLLVNVNPGGRQWAVNLIGYDTLSSFGSPSYYAQVLFKQYLGDRTVPVSLSGVPTQSRGDRTLPGLFTSATRDAKTGKLFLKVVNALGSTQDVTINLAGASVDSEGTLVEMKGELTDINTLQEPKKVAPASRPLSGVSPSFRHTFAPHSITILELRFK